MRRWGVVLALAGVVVMTACAPAVVVSRGPTDRGEVALTFDVAYDVSNTVAFLDVLQQYQVEATIFSTGEWADANPELVSRMATDGHLVANHSYSHPDFTALSDAEIAGQLAAADAAISARTNHSTKPYVRPPYGAQNSRVNRVLGNEGYRFDVLWTVDSLGWQGRSSSEVVQRCLDRAGPGVIYMFHMSVQADLDALPWIIQGLRDEGYTFARLDTWFP
jgi:peptidoglycan/xylan/chitin deacetylase (PgdA/CDA1 family)